MPTYLTAANTGWAPAMTARNPVAAAVPCTVAALATLTALRTPAAARLTRAFLVTTAKSGTGTRINTRAKRRNEA
jgi:hypothetical protein